MAKGKSPKTIPLSGSDWYIHEDVGGTGMDGVLYAADVPASGWIPASVPGNIQADLEAAHQLRPLWYGAGDPRLAEVAQKDWWYRRDFEVPESFADERLTLVFDGVDFACEVWLNGHRLGNHAGMFRRFAYDVAGFINTKETNQLAVKIERIPAELVHILAASDGKLSGGGENYPQEWGPDFFVNGINQTRQLLKDLKSPTNFGWDWGVNIYTLGIWQDVRLEASGNARIEWLQVRSELSDDQRQSKVRVKLEIDSKSAANVRAVFQIHGHGDSVEIETVAALRLGDNTIEADLTLQDPALWWPNGHGDQPLYTLEARLENARGGALLDARATRFGVRDIRWEQVEGAPPDFINPYLLLVNGRPVRMLGSNILPPDLLFGRMNERGLRLIRMAQQGGMNTLRVWGGGAFLSEEMHDLADELGIMLSQEFPLASCRPETDATFLANLEATVVQLVKRYGNHPCIIEWSGGNEMLWSQGEDHPALQLMTRIVAENDNRLFRATCPIQGARHSPWDYNPQTHYSHYDDEDLRDSGMQRGENRVMRYGEFGCHSTAHLEVWQREIPPADQWPPDDLDNPVLIRKNVAQAVFSEEHWLLKPRLESLFGPLDSLDKLLKVGQYLGAHGLRYAVDALRRRGKRIGGIATWVLNEPWPNGGGPYLVDYDGRPLMIYSFLKQALTPVSLSLRAASNIFDPATGLDAQLWLVSDAPAPTPDLRWQWLVRDASGRALAQDDGFASIQPIQAIDLGAIRTGPQGKTEQEILLVELRLVDDAGTLLAERLHLFGSADAPAPLAGLLPGNDEGAVGIRQTTVEASVHAYCVDGDEEILQIELNNRGRMTALFCEPHPLLAYRTDTHIDNNYAFIPPGETRAITISAAAKAQAGLTLLQTGWRVSCWNAPDVLIPPNKEVLLSVGRRDAMTREFLGYDDLSWIDELQEVTITGNRPDPAELPLLMTADRIMRFVFVVDQGREQPSRLRLHTADQAGDLAPLLRVTVNGTQFERLLDTGLGIQNMDPAHLAFPQTAEFELPAGTLADGTNTLEVRLANSSWFSWDSLDLIRNG